MANFEYFEFFFIFPVFILRYEKTIAIDKRNIIIIFIFF